MSTMPPRCPICRRLVPTDAPDVPRPFCSARCRTVDLGSWLSGSYRVSREIEEDDLDEVPVVAEEGNDRGRRGD